MVQAMIRCDVCDRYFPSKEALKQHIRDSPAHAPTFDCDDCDRSFKSNGALQQHLRDSPAHAPILNYDECDRSFKSDEALREHQPNTKAHKTSKSDERIQAGMANNVKEFNGIAPSLVKPVYQIALRFRQNRPSIQDIVRESETSLEPPIVAALWNATERLNSLDESPEDAQMRTVGLL
jgi:hypothetical protein